MQNNDSEVIVEDTAAARNTGAWKEDVVAKLEEYGGDTSGFQIPFSIHFDVKPEGRFCHDRGWRSHVG
ncbi:MAG: hypothetical protein ACLR8P_13955 [Clostridium fessum]